MAGSNAIASGSAVLTANADGLKAGLDRAAADIQKWGQKTQASLANPGGKGGGASGGGMLGGMFGAVGKGGPFVGMAGGVGVAAVAVGKLGMEVSDTLADLSKMGAAGRAMGLTSEQFTGMAGVAKSVGEDSREFIESLVTMGKLGTDAANGTAQASDAMKALGLNANDFIKLRADEQFFQVFDSLSKVGDPLQKTRLLMQAFGEDGGKYLLPLLEKTPEQLREMAAGFAVSSEKMQQATAAAKAVDGVKNSLSKVWQNLAIGLAPALEGVANFASRAMGFLQPLMDWYGRYASTALKMIGFAFDAIGDAISGAWGWLKELTSGMFDFAGEMPAVQDVVVAVFRNLGRWAAYSWDVMKAGAGVAAVGIGKVIGFVGDLADTFKGAFKSLAEAGAGAADALGLDDTKATFEKIGAAADRIGASVKATGAGMEAWGKDAIGGLGKSADAFDAWLDKKLAPKAAEAVAEGMKAGLSEGAKTGPVTFAGAMLKGSTDAYSLVLKNRFREFGPGGDKIKDVVKEQKEGNRKLKNIEKDGKKMADWVGTLGAI